MHFLGDKLGPYVILALIGAASVSELFHSSGVAESRGRDHAFSSSQATGFRPVICSRLAGLGRYGTP